MRGWLSAAWKYLGDVERFVFKEGRWSIDPIHEALIEAVLANVDEEVASVVRRQLAQKFFFSWLPDGRINVFYFYFQDRLGLIADKNFRSRTYKVNLWIDGRKSLARVSFWRGRIFSVELSKPRRVYHAKKFKVGRVTIGETSGSFTNQIDREEHA